MVSSWPRCPEAEGGVVFVGKDIQTVSLCPVGCALVVTHIPSVALQSPFTHHPLQQDAEAPSFRGKAVRAASPLPVLAQELCLTCVGMEHLSPKSVALPVHPLLPVWIEQNLPFLRCVRPLLG